MYKNLILSYAKSMSIEDVNNYIKKNNINILEQDKITIYNHIKKYYNVFFNDPIKYIKMLKNKIDDEAYYSILLLYDKYKDKI